MSENLKLRRVLFRVLLVVLLYSRGVEGSSAAAQVSEYVSSTELKTDECSGIEEEGQVLCEASRRRDDSISQVIAEDESVGINQDSDPPSAQNAGNVWTTAYEQWVKGDGSSKGAKLSTGAARALGEAEKRFGAALDSKENDAGNSFEMPELNDDELTRITAAVHTLAKETLGAEEVNIVLDTIDYLCSSVDNGRQLEAAGGVPHILRNVVNRDTGVSVMALKTLATCAQNNPSVFETAVNKHSAIITLLDISKNAKEALDLRAAALRALVALSVASEALNVFAENKSIFVQVVMDAVGSDGSEREARRCVTRGFAVAEQCLVVDLETWKTVFAKVGLDRSANAALKNVDIDIREGAARVLKLLR